MNQKLFLVRMLVGAVIAFNAASISVAAPDAPEPRPSTLGASDPLKLPTIIYLMRHAEKPAAGNPHLSAEGVARAEKLPSYLPSLLKSGQKIDYIFATKASADSNRPVETITPLAGALGLTINDSYDAKSYRALAKTILSDETYAQKVIVISWHHSTLESYHPCVPLRRPQTPQCTRVLLISMNLSVAGGQERIAASKT